MEFSLSIFILLPLHFLLCQSWCNPSLTARCCLSCTGRAVRPPYSASCQPGFLHKLGPRSGSAFPCWLLPISVSSRHSLTLSVLVPTSSSLLAGKKCRLELLNTLEHLWEDALCQQQCPLCVPTAAAAPGLGGIWNVVTLGAGHRDAGHKSPCFSSFCDISMGFSSPCPATSAKQRLMLKYFTAKLWSALNFFYVLLSFC